MLPIVLAPAFAYLTCMYGNCYSVIASTSQNFQNYTIDGSEAIQIEWFIVPKFYAFSAKIHMKRDLEHYWLQSSGTFLIFRSLKI